MLAGPALTAAPALAQDAVTSLLRPHAPAAKPGAAPVRRAGRAAPCAREAQGAVPGVGGVAGSALGTGGSGAGEYARFLPQAAGAPAPPSTNDSASVGLPLIGAPTAAPPAANPNRPQRPAPGTAIPAWADRPLYAETTRPLWSSGESGKRNGAEKSGRRADPIPPSERLATGADRRLWNPGESAKPASDDKSGRQADAPPADPTRAINLDPPLWNDGSSTPRSPAPRSPVPCEGSGEAVSGPDAGRF